MMKVKIINIGDELLIGQINNTNGRYLAQKLSENQFEVGEITTIGDDIDSTVEEFQKSFEKYDIVITTGGLGPTHDDVTKLAIKKFFNVGLVENEYVLEDLKDFFAARGREVTDVNLEQAMVPENAKVIFNKKGTAPGLWIENEGKILISMPGVPHELYHMFENSVLPNLIEMNDVQTVKLIKTFNTTGIPESELYLKLKDLTAMLVDTKLAFLPTEYGVDLKVEVIANESEIAQNRLMECEQKIRAIIGRKIYGTGDVPLENVVARLLRDRGLTISCAESCTGGLISSRLTNVPGSSEYYNRGAIVYSNGAKVELLQIDENLLEKYGAVSREVAMQMAEGIRAVSGTDIGLAVTGIMGPGGATLTKPVGLVYIGICDETVVTAREFKFGNDRIINKIKTSQAALDLVRRHLLRIPLDE